MTTEEKNCGEPLLNISKKEIGTKETKKNQHIRLYKI